MRRRPAEPAVVQPATDLSRWRPELLDRLLEAVFWLAVVVATPSAGFAFVVGDTLVVIVNALGLGCVAWVTYHRSLSYRLRALVLLGVAFGVGVVFTASVGFLGLFFLLGLPVFATVLFGLRAAVISLAVNAVTMVTLGATGQTGPPAIIGALRQWQVWPLVTVNLLFISSLMAISTAVLLRRLEQSLVDEQAVSTLLFERNEQLERSEQTRVAFLRAVSHELRTPLSSVVGFTETLRDHRGQLDDAEQALLLDRMAVNADRLTALISDLLDVDRLETGLATVVRRRIDLADLVRQVVNDDEGGIPRVDTDLQAVEIEVDPAKIERVVANLVANALRHSPPDGRVRITTFSRDGHAVVQVDDDGPGIASGYLDAIFEPFVQGPERHDDPQPGTGLGLTLARQIARLHGGDVRAHNREGGGACFEVVLPLPDTAALS